MFWQVHSKNISAEIIILTQLVLTQHILTQLILKRIYWNYLYQISTLNIKLFFIFNERIIVRNFSEIIRVRFSVLFLNQLQFHCNSLESDFRCYFWLHLKFSVMKIFGSDAHAHFIRIALIFTHYVRSVYNFFCPWFKIISDINNFWNASTDKSL